MLLKHYFKGRYCVENVVSFYEPLIKPFELASHYFWANFYIRIIEGNSREHHGTISDLQDRKGFDLSKYSGIDKRKAIRNCVEPEVGLHILKYAMKEEDDLFKVTPQKQGGA